MFNTTAEFEAKVRYYLAHEEERLALVGAARHLVVERHEWLRRGAELAGLVRAALPEYWWRDHRERQGRPALPALVELGGPGGEVALASTNQSAASRGARGKGVAGGAAHGGNT